MMSGHGEKPIFFNRKEITCGRSQHSETPHPLCPITSHFCLTPPPSKWTSYVYHSLSQQRKKYSIKIISSYVILIHLGNQALRFFFISLKGNGNNSYFCIPLKISSFTGLHYILRDN